MKPVLVNLPDEVYDALHSQFGENSAQMMADAITELGAKGRVEVEETSLDELIKYLEARNHIVLRPAHRSDLARALRVGPETADDFIAYIKARHAFALANGEDGAIPIGPIDGVRMRRLLSLARFRSQDLPGILTRHLENAIDNGMIW